MRPVVLKYSMAVCSSGGLTATSGGGKEANCGPLLHAAVRAARATATPAIPFSV